MSDDGDEVSTGGKRAATRRRIFEAALACFRDKGFDGATMRDIAAAAGMSLGASYYYFPSKEALVLAYYRELLEARWEKARTVFAETDDLGERVRALFRHHLELARKDRTLIVALARAVADPSSTTSIFASTTRDTRNRVIDLHLAALQVDEVPEELRDLGALGMWTLELAFLLYFVWDDSESQKRTGQLVEGALDLVLPLVPFLATPFAAPLVGQLATLLVEAGLVPDDAGPDAPAPDDGAEDLDQP